MCDSSEQKISEREEGSSVQCSTTGCPFWGRKSTNNLCSRCYKQSLENLTNTANSKVSTTASPVLETPSTTLDTKNASFVSSVNSSTCSLPELVSIEKTPESNTQKADSSEKTSATSDAKSLKFELKPFSSVKISPQTSELAKETRKLEEVEQLAETVKVQKDKRRCLECNKFLGISGFTCRCNFVFCGEHRVPDKHNCSFDLEAFAKEKFLQNKFEAANFDKFKRDTEKL